MPFTLERYSEVRPFLYHLTARENLAHIRSTGQLQSAAVLLGRVPANMETLRTRRNEKMPVYIDAETASLRDQTPLHENNIQFLDKWELEDVVESLNSRVFFWSGWRRTPIPSGERHFNRYRQEHPVILRAPFESVCRCNPGRTPLFCKYNSGAPRQSQGRKSPRGPDTFLPAECFPYNPGNVVEVTFLEHVMLPDDTEMSDHVDGPWCALFNYD